MTDLIKSLGITVALFVVVSGVAAYLFYHPQIVPWLFCAITVLIFFAAIWATVWCELAVIRSKRRMRQMGRADQ